MDDVRSHKITILCCATMSESIPLVSNTTGKSNFQWYCALVATKKIKLVVVLWMDVPSHAGSNLSKSLSLVSRVFTVDIIHKGCSPMFVGF